MNKGIRRLEGRLRSSPSFFTRPSASIFSKVHNNLNFEMPSQDRISPPPLKKRRIVSTTTANSVASFFTAASKKEPEKIKWQTIDSSLLVAQYGEPSRPLPKPRKLALFDLDGTIITTASGREFSKDASDWKFWDSQVPGKLRELNDLDYQIILISNQSRLNLEKIAHKGTIDYKEKAGAVLHCLDLPVSLYAATKHDRYRKPNTGIWDRILEDHGLQEAGDVDTPWSFFIGDAAGRSAVNNQAKADFSCSDRDFATNVGISFHTPEEYFFKEAPRPFKRKFDPTAYLRTDQKQASNQIQFTKQNNVEVVLFVGLPGAGKSTYYRTFLESQGYERINQDILKTRERCLRKCSEFISSGQSVAVDNTNMDRATREHWVRLCKSLGVPIRCLVFTASPELCQHNDAVRALNTGTWNPENRTRLPKNLPFSFKARYEEPTLNEGFASVDRVEFEFNGDAKIWGKFWT